MLLHVIFIFVSTDIDRDEDWLSRWDMLYTKIDSDRQTLTSVCVWLSQKWMWSTDSIGRWMFMTTLTTSLPSLFW